MLWDANSQPHFVEEEIEAGERSSFARAAVQTPDRRRVKKLGVLLILAAQGSFFWGMRCTTAFLTERGGTPSGNRMAEGRWAPSPEQWGPGIDAVLVDPLQAVHVGRNKWGGTVTGRWQDLSACSAWPPLMKAVQAAEVPSTPSRSAFCCCSPSWHFTGIFLTNYFAFHYSRNTSSRKICLFTNWRTAHILVLAPAHVPSL